MRSGWAFFGFDQAAVGAVAVGVVLGSPAAADGDGFRAGEFQDCRLHVGTLVGAVAEGQVLAAGAAAVGDAFRFLFDDRRFDQIFIG